MEVFLATAGNWKHRIF